MILLVNNKLIKCEFMSLCCKSTNFLNRAFFAQGYYNIPSVTLLIIKLKSDPNLRQLCGFKRVPGNSSFSRKLSVNRMGERG